MTFSEKVTKMIDIIKNARLQLIAKGETVEYDDDIPEVIEHMSGGSQDTQQIINLIQDNDSETSMGIYSIAIPNGCTKIRSYAFYDCYNLEDVTIPESVIEIGSNAFYQCLRLKSITIPNGVMRIKSYMCAYCGAMTKATIPQSVTYIESYAFYNCKRLETVDLTAFINPNSIPTLANKNAFSENKYNRVFLVANVEMLSAFESDSSWASFSGNFLAI